jgi:protein-disulfide isomerase
VTPLQTDTDRLALSRAQRRQQAREARLALEQARVERDLRQRRLRWLSGVLVVFVSAVIAVLIATGQGQAQHNVAPQSAEARAVTATVTGLLAGIPQRGAVLGRPTAPVTLQYFGDLECPVCRSFATQALPPLIHRWVRTGELKIEYRSLETATREPEVFNVQQAAALSAGRQNRMWNFLETFYAEQGEEGTGYVTEAFIAGIARQVPGLALARWSAAREDPAFTRTIAADAQAAANDGLNGTPAFLIGRSGSNARIFEPSSFTEAQPFDRAVEASLAS